MNPADNTNSLCFDDILLVPKQSVIETRSEIVLKTVLGNPGNPEGVLELDLPIILAPMENISSVSMIAAVSNHGGLGFIHRYEKKEDRLEKLASLSSVKNVGFSLGLRELEDKDFIKKALNLGVRVLLLDTAFGHTGSVVTAVKKLRSIVARDTHIMSGNVSSYDAYVALMGNGSDSVRVGIGGGAACTTRLSTGFGVPVLGSIMDVCSRLKPTEINGVISDGGVKHNGDIVKALAAGARAVMMGHLFSGHNECDSLEFRGLASPELQKEFMGSGADSIYAEGVSGKVVSKGDIETTLQTMKNNIKSGLSYCGSTTVDDLRKNASYIRISQSSLQESISRL